MPQRSSKKRNIRDVNALASHIIEQATGESKLKPEDAKKNPAVVALCRLGGLKGGKARASKMSPEQRDSKESGSGLGGLINDLTICPSW